MSLRRTRFAALSAALVVAVAATVTPSPAAPAKKDTGVEIGSKAPAWSELEGVDGKKHSLADLDKAKAVVVVFTCNHCPVAKAYEDRLIQLDKDYADRDVEVVAINVNNMDADKLPAMKRRAELKGFPFAYLYDPSQEIGREFGATVTPHAFVLDGAHNVVYKGAIDDNMKGSKASETYVRDAVDAVLAGNQPTKASTPPAGCGIQYE